MSNEQIINEHELAIAEKEAAVSADVYTHTFRQPKTYFNSKTRESMEIETMTFDFGKLTAQDSLSAELEMDHTVVVPAFNGEYLLRIAAKVSNPKVATDFFRQLPLREFNKIRGATRSFLLKSESESETAVNG